MADRRAEDTPLAPRRTLGGPGRSSSDDTGRRPLSERVSAAVSAAGSAVQQAASPSGPSTGTTTAHRPSSSPRPAGARPRTRRARLRLVHLDPWSVMKTSFLLAVAFGVVTFVAIFMVWSVLGAAGVWDSINSAVASIVEGDSGNSTFDVTDYVGMSRVLGFTLLVSVLDVVLITAIATLTAFLYNLAAALLGGIEVTLAEDEK